MKWLLFLFLLSGCQQEDTLFTDWKNPLDSGRTLSLSEGKVGGNSRAFATDEHCHFDVNVKGKKRMGTIEVLTKSNLEPECHKHVPTKMQYKAIKGNLRVCSDYADGSHTCENMIKM